MKNFAVKQTIIIIGENIHKNIQKLKKNFTYCNCNCTFFSQFFGKNKFLFTQNRKWPKTTWHLLHSLRFKRSNIFELFQGE